MNISLENWLRNKLHEVEETHNYGIATETVRAWIDQYNELNVSDCPALLDDKPPIDETRLKVATAAMQGILSNNGMVSMGSDNTAICSEAIWVADELLKQLEK